ncbi:MAG: FAD-binding oxidoreductase [Nitrospirales bacterium]
MRYRYTSHESFDHDSIDALGYDWERVADPNIKPKFPFKVYLPRSTAHVAAAVKEAVQLGQRLRVRSKGHSSNDLVLAEDGVVLCTEKLNQVVELDVQQRTIRIQSGAVLAEIDEYLAEYGLGLPVIGDHNHITAGGFASVGGISPASHRFGLFIDNVLALEYVDWAGDVRHCGRNSNREEFYRILGGTGRHGVITEMTCRLEPGQKFRTIVRNQRKLFFSADAFIDGSQRLITDPGQSLYERGVWVDFPLGVGNVRIGQFSSYFPTSQNLYTRLRKRLAYGYLHMLGRWAGRLPKMIDVFVKFLGMFGIILSPRYGSIKDVESFTDKVLDSSAGDPTRMLIVLAPSGTYSAMFRAMYAVCLESRRQHGAITFISFYVKAISSEYLAAGNGSGQFAELMLYLGIDPQRMTPRILDDMVLRIDNLCIEKGALRYMHSKTSKDAERLRRIDPNYLYPQG